jgi:hypothetical protein
MARFPTPETLQPVVLATNRLRRIGPIGTVSRFLVGGAFVVAAASIGIRWLDLLVGLVVANVAVIAVLWFRGRDASPLRATGSIGHCVNCGLIVLFFALLPVGALLFYGTAMVLAALAGSAGCEMLAVSNMVRVRDDEIGCALFGPVDALDGKRPATPFRQGIVSGD